MPKTHFTVSIGKATHLDIGEFREEPGSDLWTVLHRGNLVGLQNMCRSLWQKCKTVHI